MSRMHGSRPSWSRPFFRDWSCYSPTFYCIQCSSVHGASSISHFIQSVTIHSTKKSSPLLNTDEQTEGDATQTLVKKMITESSPFGRQRSRRWTQLTSFTKTSKRRKTVNSPGSQGRTRSRRPRSRPEASATNSPSVYLLRETAYGKTTSLCMKRTWAPLVPQCDCIAHEWLKETESLTETDLDDMKTIIRSAALATADAGCNNACALLRRLFTHMGMSNFRAERSGTDFSVSYTLLFSEKRYCFCGVPDFIVFREVVEAGRILVTTGEIQSTNRPAVQNSMYAVGSLVGNNGKRPILCLTIFKIKLPSSLSPTPM